jgi:hypothetical protein
MFLFMDRLSIDAIIYCYCHKLFFYFAVDKNKQPATFWSCLRDIQEGLHVICLSVSNLFFYLAYKFENKCLMGVYLCRNLQFKGFKTMSKNNKGLHVF